ncbi:PDR/VanB family oxidoreductase [Azospirillum sp. TSO35-2]|uniref:PDR/VanB family oxidoreductase n=1 Tax=Azospirillum sp. TSO35-2 TaxID=716796 RepID=UPI000D607F65|nr:PDR/VanB family oxidoreductase [Azospirillum sp. TSO35-2]PWC39438.1 Vanillate O-demethylase oxidoreductase [Azospirillum sp. TSO35-2]
MSEESLTLMVVRRREQGNGVAVLDLARRDGGDLPAFEAGAHIDLHLGADLVRQYSLCGDPADRRVYRLGILRDPNSRGGSVAVHDRLREGTEVIAGAPRNLFPLAGDAAHSILIGGGIGITPMIAMAHALHHQGRSFALHYCVRSRDACAFLDELAEAPFRDRVALHTDDGPAGQRLDLDALFGSAVAGTHVYVCGPTGFMEWVIAGAERLGVPAGRIHREYFQAITDTGGTAFEVVAKRSGKTVQVAAGQTIVEALAGVGIKVKMSCEQGVCGTCLCNVLDGTPDHRDVYLTDEEKADNDQILLCCSRAKSATLVLDL